MLPPVLKYKKKKIPEAIRQQVWLRFKGRVFEDKCSIIWCSNIISVFNYHVGHNIPESKGGGNGIDNLRPICSNCNLSMSSQYSISEWNNTFKNRKSICNRLYDYVCDWIRA